MEPARSVAVVLPAYNEEPNLARTVRGAQDYLSRAMDDYRVVVVDDGSADGTGTVAAALAATDPEHVIVVTHPVNRGYGAAVRSGIAAALATECPWIFLTDADGQFDLSEIGMLLGVAGEEQADLVTGWRTRRADSTIRRLNATLWSTASRLLLGLHVHDVDCAFKLVHRRVLAGMTLEGEAAVISPELLAKTAHAGYRIVEVPVSHFPREAGEQSGANLKVIVRSLFGLVRLRLSLVRAPAGAPGLPRRTARGSAD
ncbi:MAG TPA: glycosyltransferase family 2 protein [Thermomicrobiaceae bacterium]|nr:glycosyltransferase family 2 protein [Thermomicrobiaceae bacterium]